MEQPNQKPARDLLFWSGGKDSYLALLYYFEHENDEPVLLTTYDDERKTVPHQNIPVKNIYDQSIALGLPLITVPLSYPATNKMYMSAIKKSIQTSPFQIKRVVFGDLRLADIKKWRETEFENLGLETLFPVWQKPYDELFERIERENVTVRITGVSEEYRDRIKPGTIFNRNFIDSLPEQVDPMGENGEFHTEVLFEQ